jgi:regulator of replication initiation timing
MLNVENKSEIHYFKLVPIGTQEVDDLVNKKQEIGFRIDSYSGMNMRKILGYMEENKQLKIQVERLKDSL